MLHAAVVKRRQAHPLPDRPGPQWSKDGKHILCQTVQGHIHQVDADGGNWEQVTFGADVQHDARYSPDGSMILFCRAHSPDGPWRICVKALDGDDLDFVQLTNEGSNLLPDWHADEDLASQLGQVLTVTGRLKVGKVADYVDTEQGAVYLVGKLPFSLDNPSPFGKRVTVTGVLRYSPPRGFDKKTAVPGVAAVPAYYYIESPKGHVEKE